MAGSMVTIPHGGLGTCFEWLLRLPPCLVTIPHGGLGTVGKAEDYLVWEIPGHHPTRWAWNVSSEIFRSGLSFVTIPHGGLRTLCSA